MKQDFVTGWVINKVKEEYANDIALVVSHTTLRIDDSRPVISYFVPVTKRGEELAQTFILGGTAYDIWCISWERLERFAELEEYNITCLADAEVLYARTKQEKERFEKLKKMQADNLADEQKARACALWAYGQAKSIYLEMLFSSGSDVKLGAGYVLDYLARAIAFVNHSYFKRSQTDQLNELRFMENVPEGFEALYRRIIAEKEEEMQKRKCHELITLVQRFLTDGTKQEENKPCERNYQDLADWYGELSYTWLRIRHYAQEGDSLKVYMWGIYLQSELNDVCRDFGIEKIELMKYYDTENLQVIAERAKETEQRIRAVIVDGGGKIREYADEEAFLHEV